MKTNRNYLQHRNKSVLDLANVAAAATLLMVAEAVRAIIRALDAALNTAKIDQLLYRHLPNQREWHLQDIVQR